MPGTIAMNALALRPAGSGVQTYIRELLAALDRTTDLDLVTAVQRCAVDELPPGVRARARVRSDVNGVARAIAGFRSIGRADVIHGLDIDLPLRPSAPTVATVHDLSVFDVPWAHGVLRARGERFLVRRSIQRADALIAVSAFTASRVWDLFRREATVTRLAPPPDCRVPTADEIADVVARHELPEVFVLHLGNIEPRKDVPALAAACTAVGVPLVLAGRAATGHLPISGAHALGYVDRSDLPALYGAATVVAYPSRYEGFGLPPVEAMACGGAVLATSVGALPEVLGEAAVLVPPNDARALEGALRRLLSDEDERFELRRAALDRSAHMTWTTTAAQTAEVYRRLGADPVVSVSR